jgi:hypothetical protein
MDTKFKAGILLLGCVAALAIVRAAGVEPTGVHRDPEILFGGCGSTQGNSPGVPYVIFPLGQMENNSCSGVTGPPPHGVPMPSTGTLQNLRVTGGYSAGAGLGTTVTIYVNSYPTALTCTINSTGKCSDTTHKVNVQPGAEVAATLTQVVSDPVEMQMSLEKAM